MDLDFRTSFLCDPSMDNLGSGNKDFKPSQGPALQKAEEISELQDTQHSLFQNGNNSFAKQELQRLYKSFYLWLQPEKHSKDEIIFQVVLEQFMINRHCSDRSTLKEKWESGGRNLEKFMEGLSDGCMKPPGLVHVHMQGQEALFSENMPLREVIVHLAKQLSAGTPTGENMGTPSCTPQDTSLAMGRGDEDKENGGNIDQVNDRITSQGNEIPSLLIIQKEGCPRPEDDSVSLKNPVNSGRAGLAISGSQEGCPKGPPYQDILMEVGPGFLSQPVKVTPEPVPTHQNEGISTCEGLQERSHEAPKPYRCEKCPKIFRYFSQLKAHQRRHNNERTFICAECNKGFFQASDLHVHQMIHVKKKPFTCSTCEKSFSHKTNLKAHERIHTGEKPYACSLCRRSYRQSSTYHRHLRTHQKMTFKSAPSTPEASSAAAPM
ncbi:zinc finger and SCAN domain-containing protein 4 [Felis catus]|uniref:Zinc finger and SCAN domain containing 4 n=1 Tax=Felis catus TaxID=9685 RepID=A0ABI8AQP1_FELCA|nr:zinc finger and SCAN domain-containing protein 4 [Felis catus]XP_044903260.1 zinc finger and SCAN domain-containing protein 4 [Felis catus]XP_044903261.1 zinc finger and SCAN domain-containing protein 4 [Felis catus]XP_044903262.1 zinc finger and SCAN domain-containing protein 4 [Felis catus]XP_044903263.1 zinc finger and SCAN domain-containing protein 4 [Felis catus]